MGRNENKRKKYFKSAGKKVARVQRTLLEAGMRGFLLTCANNRERDCVRDAYSVLNTFADKLHGPEKPETESENEDDDPDVALQQEVAAIKSSNSSERRFQAVDTKCKNVIFVKTLLDHPDELLEAIMCDIMEKKTFSTSQICRIMPVVGTCKANLKTIAEYAEKVLEPFFTTKAHSFSIHVKIRNNSSLTRNDILPMMAHVIKSLNPGNCVSLGNPDYVVSFDVLTSVTCISVMQSFEQRCKYNLQELICRTQEEGDGKLEESKTVSEEATAEDDSNKNSGKKEAIAEKDVMKDHENASKEGENSSENTTTKNESLDPVPEIKTQNDT